MLGKNGDPEVATLITSDRLTCSLTGGCQFFDNGKSSSQYSLRFQVEHVVQISIPDITSRRQLPGRINPSRVNYPRRFKDPQQFQEIEVDLDLGLIEIVFDVEMTGEWSVRGNQLTEVIIDSKMSPGNEVAMQVYAEVPQAFFQPFLKGKTEVSQMDFINKDLLLLTDEEHVITTKFVRQSRN